MSSLSPWDLGGNISFDFTIYRPRRPSYVFATQMTRQRSESYRHATTSDGGVGDPSGAAGPTDSEVAAAVDSIRRKRKNSYRTATQNEAEEENGGGDGVETVGRRDREDRTSTIQGRTGVMAAMGNHVGGTKTAVPTGASSPPVEPREALLVCSCPSSDSAWKGTTTTGNNIDATTNASRRSSSSLQFFPPPPPYGRPSSSSETVFSEVGQRRHGSGADGSGLAADVVGGGGGPTLTSLRRGRPTSGVRSTTMSRCRYTKNLVVLSLSFILVFTAFRSIQNLQSSLNGTGRLGVIAMGCVHATTFLTCLFTPVLINKLTSKWTIVLGLLFYLFWIAANFCPHLFTLVPTSIGVGFGQSLAWGAQVTYIQKLVDDYVHSSGETTQAELYRFNGIFLACFQTSHVWGNLVSSLMLGGADGGEGGEGGLPRFVERKAELGIYCGVYDSCEESVGNVWNASSVAVSSASSTELKLMGSFLVFAFVGFVLILVFLEKIGTKEEPEQPCLQIAWRNLQLLFRHKIYRLLVPLLLFNGFEQGFVYSDYTKSYISCTLGIEYVGYNMITLGMTNSIFSVLVGHVARHVAREAIVGVGTILHLGLMVFLLVWIPDPHLFAVFFVISALWGVCDAIWQTQCNCLVSLSCTNDFDVAFQNFRMLQGLGASLAFFFSAFMCVYVKLCTLMALLVLSVLFYVVAEYHIRKPDNAAATAADQSSAAVVVQR